MFVRVLGAFAIGAFTMGALAVYFFGAVSGRRRRALLRNRAQGVVAETWGMIERSDP